MSRTPDRARFELLRRLRPRDGEEGFTLIEVMAAMLLFALVASAAGSMVISGLRASLVAKLDTGAKNLAQERVELMRNLPFHIDHDPAVAAGADMDDLIGNFYTDLAAAASKTARGYVAACGAQTAVCAGRPVWDPPSGSFYRRVFDPVDGYPKYRQYVAAQFINEHRQPLPPHATYTSQVAGFDLPPSQLLSVTVTTFWTAGELEKSYQIQTYIAAGRPAAAQTTFQGRSVALRLTGGLNTDQLLSLQAGLASVDGSLSSGSTASGKAQGGVMDVTNGEFREGLTLSAYAPPNIANTSGFENSRELWLSGNRVAYFGGTWGTVHADVSSNLPAVGTSGTPVQGQIVPQGDGQLGLTYYNLPDFDDALGVNESAPVAWITQSGAASIASGRGSGRTTGGSTRSVTTSVSSRALTLRMFSTSYAPQGVVQVTLTSSNLACTANPSGASSTMSYSATVSYWKHGAGYVTVPLSHLQSTDELAGHNPANIQVGVLPTGGPIWLSSFVASWNSLTSAGVTAGSVVDPDANRVTASYDGVVNIATAPVRGTDAGSALSVQLGLLSCIAEDNR